MPTGWDIWRNPGFWAGLHQLGIGADDIARTAQLSLETINQPVVTQSQYFAIWQAYSDLNEDTAEGIIKLATGYEISKYPPPVLAMYHARDYRMATLRCPQY